MSAGIEALVEEIDALSAMDSADDLSRLQDLVDRYFAAPESGDHLDVWFRLYERFPDDDGCGVFWSILHGIEAFPASDQLVVESARRRPSLFPVMMVNRLLNAGVRQVGEVKLFALLRWVAANVSCLPEVRESAESFVEHQRGRAEPGAAADRGNGGGFPGR